MTIYERVKFVWEGAAMVLSVVIFFAIIVPGLAKCSMSVGRDYEDPGYHSAVGDRAQGPHRR